jgi:Tfp pilus assembly ATPase PilU
MEIRHRVRNSNEYALSVATVGNIMVLSLHASKKINALQFCFGRHECQDTTNNIIFHVHEKETEPYIFT